MSLPVSQINPLTLERESLLDINSVSIKSMYNVQEMNVEWTYNDTVLILDSFESTTATINNVGQINHIGLGDGKLSVEEKSISNLDSEHIQRSFKNKRNTYFNPYLQKVIENEQLDNSIPWNEKNNIKKRDSVDIMSINDRIVTNLPANRTIYFDCNGPETCLEGKFRVTNIKSNNSPILIFLNFTIDMTKVAKIMNEQKDILVVRTSVDLMKTLNDDT